MEYPNLLRESGVLIMTDEELRKRIEELKADHIAAGGYISDEEAEEVIRKVYASKCQEKNEKLS